MTANPLWLYAIAGVLVLVLCWCAVYYYKQHYQPFLNPPEEIKRISAMFEKISPGTGKIPIKEGNESYTMNKSNITLCIRDPKTNKLYPWNTLVYVSLHELGHCITRTKEKDPHGPIFRRNFKRLLDRAQQLGYYDSRIPIPETYCKT